ncbi:ADP-ribose pyrophosphatase [Sphaerochaeta pleomorpha str. Grapes]|uniref:8-oxo-dGTP diphosphatase n=1 Tax=Sphaerochaeta pleomorpha (strain ATCC BAA-1885 / DSM 22778 / Grapes) TaxID=158190 RepID=G8QYF8_SPHPG|nr:NUDIX domain-containing protein [Sphaerochaeta pleomorpha]AEV30805.1 ADP-ribose pyrophosphatase [Sphaerochaeta pleomorpha str. Grapes]
MEEYSAERITTAGVLVKDQKYFVAKRDKGGSIGGLWEFPGGKNRWGETEEETLNREYQEELGLEVKVGALIHSHDFVNKGTLYHLKAYLITANDFEDLPLLVHTTFKWVDKDELGTLDFAPSDRKIVETILG